MSIEQLLKNINATSFFPERCPAITSWKHKLRGRNGRNNPVQFNEEELDQIQKGLEQIHQEFKAARKKGKK